MRNSATNELVRATKERLLELLFDDNSGDAKMTEDDTFVADFLLTFRLFFSSECVAELLARLADNLALERAVDRSLKIALFWISNHFQDFDRQLLRALEGALHSKTHKKLFYFTLSSKSRERHVTITRSERAAALPFALVGGYECSSRLFVSEVHDECADSADLQRGDRLLSINGVDCHVMEVSRALQLCKSCTHLSLLVRFDPNLFHALIDGQLSRQQNDAKRLFDGKTATLTTTSFASLKPIQQLSSSSLSSVVSANNANNNWKQKVRQIVQNVTTNNKHNNNATTATTTPNDASPSESPEVIKIYYESDFRYLPIHVTTTARECIQLALIEFQLNSAYSSRDFALYEYKLIDRTTATSAVKRLSDNYQNLVHNLSLDSRIYLKCVSATTTTTAMNDSDITREISREANDNSLLTLDGDAIARELMDRDFELFCRIESQQFIYDLTTGDDTSDDRRRELKAFEERTNREMFWTINQVLFGANSTAKRVKSVKRLIRIAQACRQLQNFNSLFAILSGLSHQSVERQKHSLWDRVPSRALQKLQKLYALMDPSRNFQHFRSQLRRCAPPVIPFFPLVKKDLSFIFLANETLVASEDSKQTLVNWEKMRLLAQKVKEVQQMTHSATPAVVATTRKTNTLSSAAAQHLKSALNDSKESNYRKMWEKQRMRKRVQHFLDSSFASIVCDENVLFDKSLECEPQTNASQRTSQTTLSSAASSQSHNSAAAVAHNSQVMPSPTLSSHSSSPSLSSSTTNSSDVQSTNSASQQRMRLRFGVRDDTGLRKLLALSDNTTHNNHNNHNIHRPNSHCGDSQTSLSSSVSSVASQAFLQSAHLLHSNYFVSEAVAARLSAPPTHSMASHYMKQSLPQESSSVTSLRRLEHNWQQMSRFRDPFLPSFNDNTTTTPTTAQTTALSSRQRPMGRHNAPPTYDQTIQRMKKKFTKRDEENVV
ncbi:unnamed protein product [Oppiella nova]|uniref:Uncharacterized protein n=1 Tax=Oppiella nova TaxID=334625 RepID=A0A7R9MFP5_9ACAR|nr:unnamed protein product [Oppiella nova]CAG2176368.1 unnamed protein product [Oppiella nova]